VLRQEAQKNLRGGVGHTAHVLGAERSKGEKKKKQMKNVDALGGTV